MKHATLGVIAAAALLHTASAHAQLNYSYVRGSYLVTSSDNDLGDSLDGKAFDVGVSYEILNYLHAFGSYRQNELDDLPLTIDTLKAGVGFDIDLSPDQSVYFDFAAVRLEATLSSGLGNLSGNNDGYGASIGYREKNQTRLEFDVRVDYIDLSDTDYTDTSITMSLAYELRRRLKIEGSAAFGGDEDHWGLGVRYYLPGPSGTR